MPSAYGHFDVDWSDIDTKELVDEARSRGFDVPPTFEELSRQLWQHFYLGREVKAMEVAREIAERATGRLVPVQCGVASASNSVEFDGIKTRAAGVRGMSEAQATPIRDALRDVQEMWEELHSRGLNPQLMRRYSDALGVLERDLTARLTDGVEGRPMADLKPCPFCDSRLLSFTQDGTATMVLCGDCAAMGPLGMDQETAAMAWNMRGGSGRVPADPIYPNFSDSQSPGANPKGERTDGVGPSDGGRA